MFVTATVRNEELSLLMCSVIVVLICRLILFIYTSVLLTAIIFHSACLAIKSGLSTSSTLTIPCVTFANLKTINNFIYAAIIKNKNKLKAQL